MLFVNDRDWKTTQVKIMENPLVVMLGIGQYDDDSGYQSLESVFMDWVIQCFIKMTIMDTFI